jgi:Domain of unknown function (DUF4279)
VRSPEYDDEYPTCARTYASLRIFSPDLDPEAVSRSLGIEATTARVSYPVNNLGVVRRAGGWMLSTKDSVDSNDLRRHIDWLLDAIEPSATALDELVQAGAKAEIFCYWESRWGSGGPVLSPAQMERLVRLDLSVGIDAYGPADRTH